MFALVGLQLTNKKLNVITAEGKVFLMAFIKFLIGLMSRKNTRGKQKKLWNKYLVKLWTEF